MGEFLVTFTGSAKQELLFVGNDLLGLRALCTHFLFSRLLQLVVCRSPNLDAAIVSVCFYALLRSTELSLW